MLQTLRETASRIWTTTYETARRTPVEVLLSMVMATAISADILNIVDHAEDFVMPALLAWLLTFSISSLHALGVIDTIKRWSLTAAYLAATGVYGVYFFDTNLDASMWRYALFVGAAFFGVTLVPLLAKLGNAPPSERFWRFNTRLLFRAAVAVVFTAGIYAGIASVMAITDTLFAFDVDHDLFPIAAAFTFMGLGGVLLAGGLSEITLIDQSYSDESLKWLGRLGTFVFVPTTLAYLAIVYLYLGNVFFTGESPSNTLSPLMLGAGILGYAGLFVLWPFIERRESALMNVALKWFPAALLPTLPVAVWAIVERIEQYGWTEFRYVRLMAVVCLGLFSLVAVVRVLQKKRFSLTSAPIILAGAALFSAVGPWSAPEVSERSQTARFIELASETGFMNDGLLVVDAELDMTDDQRDSLRSTLYYLVDTHGPETIQPFTSLDVSDHSTGWQVVEALEVRELLVGPSIKTRRFYRASDQNSLDIRTTGKMHEISLRDSSAHAGGWEFEIEGHNLVARGEGRPLTASLAPLVELAAHEKSYSIGLSGEELSFMLRTPRMPLGQLFISDIDFRRHGSTWQIESIRAEVILPR